jgi:hypothetical protein
MRRLHGVVYPDPPPASGGPAPDADSRDERAMALRFVRTAFDPPLPDPFADWIITLHRLLRDGAHPEQTVVIPDAITALGYSFMDSVADGRGIPFRDALRMFGREDLLEPEPGRHPHQGVTALAAALVARGIRTTTTLHRQAGGCTVRLTDDHAQQLADILIPQEGTLADELAQALGFLDAVTQDRDLTCALDHHGRCQEHSASPVDGKCGEPQAHAFLIRHSVREEK